MSLPGNQPSEFLDADVQDLIDRSVLCWLATHSPTGGPNVSPKEVFLTFRERLLVANIASPKTVANLQEDPRVCVAVLDIFAQRGYQLYGRAVNHLPGAAEYPLLHAPLQALAGPEYPILSVIEIDVERVLPLRAPRYWLFPETTEDQQVAAALRTYQVRPLADSD